MVDMVAREQKQEVKYKIGGAGIIPDIGAVAADGPS